MTTNYGPKDRTGTNRPSRLGHYILKSHLALGTFTTVTIGDYDSPQLLLSTTEYRGSFGGQGAITSCAEKVGVVVDPHCITLALQRNRGPDAGDGFDHRAVHAAV